MNLSRQNNKINLPFRCGFAIIGGTEGPFFFLTVWPNNLFYGTTRIGTATAKILVAPPIKQLSHFEIFEFQDVIKNKNKNK